MTTYLKYRSSTSPRTAWVSPPAVGALSNDDIDQNFATLALKSEPGLDVVTGYNSTSNTNLTLGGNNTLGGYNSNSVTTVKGKLKGAADTAFDIYGGDITASFGTNMTISAGNRTVASSMGDGAGTLIVKGGDVSVGNGYNSGGDLYLYGGDVSGSYSLPGSPEGAGGEIHIVSGTNLSTASVEKRSGDVNIDVADVPSNGTRIIGEINIGRATAYRPTVSAYASPTINIGTSTGVMFVNCPTVFRGYQVYVDSGSSLQFRDPNAAPGSVSTFTLQYSGGDLAVTKYPFGGGSSTYPFTFGNDNTFYASYGSINASFHLIAGGQVRAGGDIIAYYTSDETLKTNIVKIDSALAKVNSLDGVTFNWNEKAKEKFEKDLDVREAGVIAQQVQAVLPEVVKTREDGTLAVKYEQMVPLLIEAIKELTSQVKDLQNQLNNK